MRTTEMLDHKTKPHDDREITTTAPSDPVFRTIGIVTFCVGFVCWVLAKLAGGCR